MALPDNEQAKDSRNRILKTEAAALMLLLALRKRTVKGRPSLELIAELERKLYGAIAGVRFAARASALEFAAKHFGQTVSNSGLAGQIDDLRRARLISRNVSKMAIETLEKGGPVIKRIDQRLATIAVTENSHAYNAEHRASVVDTATKAGLVEVWDSELDSRTCEHCASLDGTESIDGMFPGGLTPGAVHRNCRCTSHFVRASLLH